MTTPNNDAPKDIDQPIEVFVSYSRDDHAHQEWVGLLADRLDAESDVHIVLDEYEIYGGKDIPHFMERCRSCERVVFIVTTLFAEKADHRRGGVGYESAIAAAELALQQQGDRFIPVLREGTRLPIFLDGKAFVDFRVDSQSEWRITELLGAIRRQPRRPRPVKLITPAAIPEALSVQELNALLREHTVDGGKVTACKSCGSTNLKPFHDTDVDVDWADGESHAHLNYFIDGVECRNCGWRRTELSDRDGKVFERQITEGN